jgi:hypothetical protein
MMQGNLMSRNAKLQCKALSIGRGGRQIVDVNITHGVASRLDCSLPIV